MDTLALFTQNLTSPAILFFVLGVFAGLIKSDLDVPEQISRYLAIYLMMAIGFKGGVAIAQTPDIDGEVIFAVAAGVGLSFLMPFIAYVLLKLSSKLDSPTAAAVAAHYGSISMVTFVTAASYLELQDISYAGYVVAILALMEAPAILSGLFIAHRTAPQTTKATEQVTPRLSREIFTNGAIMLLMGAFFIGWISGSDGMAKMEGFLVTPFQGILALFLLDMGLVVARKFHDLKHITLSVLLFGLYMPLIGASLGLLSAKLIGLDAGTGFLFTILCASASYIAVPAAMRLALPQAKAAVYLPLSLAITFPFNIVVGIPFYLILAQSFLK